MGLAAQDSLDLVIAMSNFGQEVSVFFVGDGVYQLLKEQNPVVIARKNFTKGFAALHFYDIENLYVCAKSLADRNLSPEQLSMHVNLVQTSELYTLLAQHQHVVTF
jgi:tRNA 2-thiouridine synthesizing protein C